MIKMSELSYETYRYLFDIKYFVKEVKDSGYEENDIDDILKNANILYKIFLKISGKNTKEEKTKELEKAFEIAEKVMKQLKKFKCNENFTSEKVDLLVQAFAIKEKTEVVLSKLV